MHFAIDYGGMGNEILALFMYLLSPPPSFPPLKVTKIKLDL